MKNFEATFSAAAGTALCLYAKSPFDGWIRQEEDGTLTFVPYPQAE